jgi:HAD superfamily hydrolase (TIGR01484 family)
MMAMPMLNPAARPLDELRARLLALQAQGRPLLGLFTDVDDTLTDAQGLMPAARSALHALHAAGLPVVAITGRPVGWSERFLQGPDRWPVQAIVVENGAVALLPSATGGPPVKRYQQAEHERVANARRLQATLSDIEARYPGARRADDSAGRETDLAIDHSEHHHLSANTVARIAEDLREQGYTVTVSSIHINAWIGDHDKAQGARWIVRELYARELDEERDRWVTVGDSTNDEGLFRTLPLSVGVANIERFWAQLRHHPLCVTPSARGEGFGELAALLLERC